jgi:hypothetical protein
MVLSAHPEEKYIGRPLEGRAHPTPREVPILLVEPGSAEASAPLTAHPGAADVRICPQEFTFRRPQDTGIAPATMSGTFPTAHLRYLISRQRP